MIGFRQFLTQRHHLTRTFGVGALVVVCLAAGWLAYFTRAIGGEQLQRMAEQNNVALNQAFANGVWPQYRTFIETANQFTPDELRAHPQTPRLHAKIRALMSGTRVLKVKLYNTKGLTAFSTDPSQIGSDYSTKPGFRNAILGGTLSALSFRETFTSIDGPVTDRWVLASYIPLRSGSSADGPVEGVAEIYSDVTDIHAYIRTNGVQEIFVVALAFGLVFLLLLAMVWWAERQIRRHYQESLERTAEAARADSANRAKSDFLANMSHELRTPLNAIIGFAEVIKDGMFGPIGEPRYQQYVADIHSSGQHLLSIINDVLDLAKVESGKVNLFVEEFDVVETVWEVVKLVESETQARQIKVSIDAPKFAVVMQTDQSKVRQILLNLVSNAVKFTLEGGDVTMRVIKHRLAESVDLVVEDNGIGMDPADIPRALAPFSQIDNIMTKRFAGTGLGLPISQQLAELLGGNLRIDSARNVGTMVTVSLPTYAPGKKSAEMASAA